MKMRTLSYVSTSCPIKDDLMLHLSHSVPLVLGLLTLVLSHFVP